MHRQDNMRVISKTPLYKLPELRDDLRQYSKTPLHVVNLDDTNLVQIRKIKKIKTAKDKYISESLKKQTRSSFRTPSIQSPVTARERQFCFDNIPEKVFENLSVLTIGSCNHFKKISTRRRSSYLKSKTMTPQIQTNSFKLEPIHKKLQTVKCTKYHETIRDQMFQSIIEEEAAQNYLMQIKTRSFSPNRTVGQVRTFKPFAIDSLQVRNSVTSDSMDPKEEKWMSLSRWDS